MRAVFFIMLLLSYGRNGCIPNGMQNFRRNRFVSTERNIPNGMKRKLYFLFSQSVFNFENMRYEGSVMGCEVNGERYEVSGGAALCCPRGATAHREADEREYHPLGWSAGMRVCRVVREPAYSKISYSKDCVWEEILRLPCRADLEDGRAGGYSMSLDFFAYFFYQEKKYEKKCIRSNIK